MNGPGQPAGPHHSGPGRATSPTGTPPVQDEIAALPDLSRAALVEQWITAHSRPPPKGLSRRLLEYAAAYNLQSKAFGALKKKLGLAVTSEKVRARGRVYRIVERA